MLLLVHVYVPQAPSPEPAAVVCHSLLAGLVSAVVTLPTVTVSLLSAQTEVVSHVMVQLPVAASMLAAEAQLVAALPEVAWLLAVRADLAEGHLALQQAWP